VMYFKLAWPMTGGKKFISLFLTSSPYNSVHS
jgi:hypothetical protein